jgi:hypothetical protein
MNWPLLLALIAVGQSALLLFVVLGLLVTRTSPRRLLVQWRLLVTWALVLAAMHLAFAIGSQAIGWLPMLAVAFALVAVGWAYSITGRLLG